MLRRTCLCLVAALAASTAVEAAEFPPSVNLGALVGPTGTRADGFIPSDYASAGDALGFAVAGGDFNGDDLVDVALGAPAGGDRPGTVFVVFGRSGGLPYPLDLNGPGVLRIGGVVTNSQLGGSLAAGDVNGDGVTDLVIGAPGESAVFVLFGQRTTFPPGVGVSMLSRMQGPPLTSAGYSVGVGDLNGDGIGDIAIGNGAPSSGAGYVVFGRRSAWYYIDLASLDGMLGVQLVGLPINARNVAVAATGDITGDGIGDVLVGSPDGALVHVLHGRTSFGGAIVNLGDPTVARRLMGPVGSWFGFAVSGIADINGDGYRDIAVGGPFASTNSANNQAGMTYVVYGGPALPPLLDVSTLDGSNGGFRILGASIMDRSGWSVAAGGDVNSDGRPDLLIGAPFSSYSARAAGAAYVIYGRNGPFQNINLNGGFPNALDGRNGFQIVGIAPGDQAGFSVAAAGDVGGDGGSDIVIGARNALIAKGSGFVLYGRSPPDVTPPTIDSSRNPATNAQGWNNTSVTVTFSCSDGQSGIQSCTPATTLSAEGAGQSVTGTAVDNAGNAASATVGDMNIDLTPPSVGINGVVEGRVYRSAPAPQCVAGDALAGLAVAPMLAVVRGATVRGVTAYTVTCSGAQDNAGNTASAVSVSYSVRR